MKILKSVCLVLLLSLFWLSISAQEQKEDVLGERLAEIIANQDEAALNAFLEEWAKWSVEQYEKHEFYDEEEKAVSELLSKLYEMEADYDWLPRYLLKQNKASEGAEYFIPQVFSVYQMNTDPDKADDKEFVEAQVLYCEEENMLKEHRYTEPERMSLEELKNRNPYSYYYYNQHEMKRVLKNESIGVMINPASLPEGMKLLIPGGPYFKAVVVNIGVEFIPEEMRDLFPAPEERFVERYRFFKEKGKVTSLGNYFYSIQLNNTKKATVHLRPVRGNSGRNVLPEFRRKGGKWKLSFPLNPEVAKGLSYKDCDKALASLQKKIKSEKGIKKKIKALEKLCKCN